MSAKGSHRAEFAMRGNGFFSAVNKSAKSAIDNALPLLLNAICQMPDENTADPFTIADFGCADGGTSIDLMRRAITAVRSRWPRRPICIVYADQVQNDYNALF